MENAKQSPPVPSISFSELWHHARLQVTDAFTAPPVILRVEDSIVGTLGNFSASTGKAKSKKTFNVCAIINRQNKAELAKLVEEKTDHIRKENREFYKDLESTVKIKLDENKSEIKQLIENERTHIKQIFEIEFAKNTKELKQAIETEVSKQTQLLANNQKTIKTLLWVLGGLTVILSVLAVYKLWLF